MIVTGWEKIPRHTPLQTNMNPWKWLKVNGWFRCIPYWSSPFLGVMSALGDVMLISYLLMILWNKMQQHFLNKINMKLSYESPSSIFPFPALLDPANPNHGKTHSPPPLLIPALYHTVDGSEIPRPTTWNVYNLANNRINYQPQLVSFQYPQLNTSSNLHIWLVDIIPPLPLVSPNKPLNKAGAISEGEGEVCHREGVPRLTSHN